MSAVRKTELMLLLGCSGLIMSEGVLAERPAAEVVTADVSQEIVVTSQKREARLLDVPLAVTALGARSLEVAGVRNFADYARSIPGLSFSDLGNGRQQPSIRGINVNIGAAVVGYYVDETPIPASLGTLRLATIDPRLFDIERIEVLRGPQGTLYGSGSMGGTIRILPKRPDPSGFAGAARVTGDVTDGRIGGALDLMANLPVTENLALRATGWTRQSSGFIDRRAAGAKVDTVPGEDTVGTRAVLEYRASPFRLEASIYHQVQRFDGFQNVTFGPDNREGRPEQNLLFDIPEPNRNRFTLLNLTGEVDLGFAKFLSSTSYYKGGFRAAEETAALLQAFIGPTFPSTIVEDSRQTSFSQELRLASSRPIANFDWIIGAFYNHDTSDRTDDLRVPEYTAIVGNDLLFGGVYTGKSTQKALFGELAFHPLPNVVITAGGRYYDVSSFNRTVADGLFNGGPSVNQAGSSATGTVGKLNLSWKASEGTLLYAQVAQGFRPGFGTDRLPGTCDADAVQRGLDPNAGQVRPDKVVNYEAGAKGSLLDGRLRTSLSVYRNDWRDIQLAVFLPCGFKQSANAGDVRIQGIELESSLRLGSGIEVGGTLSYVHDEFTRTLQGIEARSGDPVLNVPTWGLSGYAQISFTPRPNIDAFLRFDAQHSGSALQFYDRVAASAPAPLQYRQRPALTLLNVRLQIDGPKWSAALYGRNLADTRKITGFAESISANIADRPRFAINPPRTFGVELTRRF